MAEHVWAYATGERGAERARVGLEHAGAEFKRAAAPFVRELNAIERGCTGVSASERAGADAPSEAEEF